MALSSYTYGTVNGVWRRIAWVVPNRQYFDGSTTPTLQQVEDVLDQIASEIHMALALASYPTNTLAWLTANAARAAAYLAALNEDGAAAQVAMMFPTSGDPDTGENRPAAYWEKRYRRGLDMLQGNGLDSLGLTRDEALSEGLFSGSYQDEDGYDKLPMFTRAMSDFPGSRSLTTEAT